MLRLFNKALLQGWLLLPLCLHVATHCFSRKPAKRKTQPFYCLNRSTDISPQLNAAAGEVPAWVHSSSAATRETGGPSLGYQCLSACTNPIFDAQHQSKEPNTGTSRRMAIATDMQKLAGKAFRHSHNHELLQVRGGSVLSIGTR